MSELMEQFEGEASDALAKEAREADLLAAGRYKFQVTVPNIATDTREFFDKEETKRNPFYGKKVANMQVSLTSKRDGEKKDSPWVTLERSRLFNIRVCPSIVKREEKLTDESKLFGQMIDVAVKAEGRALTNQEVIEWFTNNLAEVRITLSEATEKYAAKNWVREIKAVG